MIGEVAKEVPEKDWDGEKQHLLWGPLSSFGSPCSEEELVNSILVGENSQLCPWRYCFAVVLVLSNGIC